MINVCFTVLGVGQGHITQAKYFYNLLKSKKEYDIKFINIICRYEIFKKNIIKYKLIFPDCKIKNINIKSNENDISNIFNINIISNFKIIYDSLLTKDTNFLFKKYKINLNIGFFIPKLYLKKPSVKTIDIANQYSVNNFLIDMLGYNKLANNITPISIINKNKFSKYVLPSLISNVKLTRHNVDKNICVAYAVSNIHFAKKLNIIAKNNPKFKIYFFMNEKPSINLESNIKFKFSSTKFKKYLNKASCVLSTSGNELIQECVYNNIPIATMPCNNSHFEQLSNYKNYINLKYVVPMDKNIKLNKLRKLNINNKSLELEKTLKNRDKIIMDILDKIVKS